MSENLATMAHKEWRNRPADQRFTSLPELKAAVDGRRKVSYQTNLDVADLEFMKDEKDGIWVAAPKKRIEALPTNWAFGQAATLVKAPASYLRTLPTDIAIAALNYGVQQREASGIKLLTYEDEKTDLTRVQAFTSQTYGRIWDADVVAAAEKIVDASGGRFFNPKLWSGKQEGLYASDHDVFMFFVDGGSMVDGGGERDQLNRGFYMWNSEVGSATFGLASFLFRVVCGNYLVWGMQDVKLLKIRHTSGGPERFINEAIPALAEYTNASAKPVEEAVKKAKAFDLPIGDKEHQSFS